MKVLIIGSGGREHALAWKLKQSPRVSELFCAPGNGGTHQVAKNIDIPADQIVRLKDWAVQQKIDFTVVGPEQPLSLGIVDLFEKSGLVIFGVSQCAAQLESSKVFSKQLMQDMNIPTASAAIFTDAQQALKYLSEKKYPVVIKADGLAAGKGVVICASFEMAKAAVHRIMVDKVFKEAGCSIVIEDYLEGEELSVIGFVDGETFLPLASSQDHKRVFDGDEGPNTGGMGAYSPVPWVDHTWMSRIQTEIVEPLLKGLKQKDILFKGILYMGLMRVGQKLYVLEFNTRLGDPEAQVLLVRLKSDLLPLMVATVQQRLRHVKPSDVVWDPSPAACVVMSSEGYPGKYKRGIEIQGTEALNGESNLTLFHAGTVLKNGAVFTSGGRVLNIVASGDSYERALERAYRGVSQITWPGAHYRKDIGYRVCQRQK